MNETNAISFVSGARQAGAMAFVSMALFGTAVFAQGVHRIVGPDGRVTYSDQPPPAGATVRPAATGPAPASNPANAQLPFELRQVANRYPVTLYTSSECAPCNSGRNLLNSRGIPYAEKTIGTAQETDALKRLSGESSLPFLTIGGQQIKGYSDAEWSQFLDAAGYPKQSQLPGSYRRPASTPLVAVKPADTAPARTTTSTARPPAAAETPVAPPVNNPAGIRF